MDMAKRKAKDNPANEMMMPLILVGGGLVLYWYLNNYGPNGAVTNSAGAVVGQSWWQSWFGGTAAAAANTTTTTTGGTAPAATATICQQVLSDTAFWAQLTSTLTLYGMPSAQATAYIANIQSSITTSVSNGCQNPPGTTAATLEAALSAAVAQYGQQYAQSQVSGSAATLAPSTPASPVATSNSVATALISAAGGNASTQLTASQWNYYYAQLYGQPSTPMTLGDNGQPMSVGTYIGYLQSNGWLSPTGTPLTTPQLGPATTQITGGGGAGVQGIVPVSATRPSGYGGMSGGGMGMNFGGWKPANKWRN
jgi:hypothetical protein